ncbi:Ig-like domain-containing protein [Flavobacteriaceae bacterium S356]|uniref:Ig-like domain-containing protein n=1 Tax=Asprobacillus argus TaxID=3076534 RepID=A0ABU3LDY6_9FLAO|nr:Ig-like domain-containing protein [Flavobacteriaceae bacterium S356]
MDVIPTHISTKRIKALLIFFCATLFLLSCGQEAKVSDISVHYEGNKGLSVHFKGFESPDYQIVTKENDTVPILGELNTEDTAIIFTPVIPFNNGGHYQILKEREVVGEFHIKESVPSIPPKVVAIYPKLDTVPENLLKMYIVFSKPMQEVRSSLEYIKVINLHTQKEEAIFLPLETELWNADHTELTLWLDPGRIKKDLIPNKKLGIPIKNGNSYEVILSKEWNDAEGSELAKEYRKKIVVVARDAKMPSVKQWKLTVPNADSKEALGIAFDELMDAMLIEKSIVIMDAQDQSVAGGFLTMGSPNSTLFIPKERWKKGTYTMVVQSSMEDLAGNNLNRLFDTDLQQEKKTKDSKTKTITFTIQ